MGKIAIVTDSNSGITQARGKELGIYVLPMPFFIDGEIYYEDITLTQEQFYDRLGADSNIFYISAVSRKCDGTMGEDSQGI